MDLIFEQYTERLKRKRKSPHTIYNFGIAAKKLDAWLVANNVSAEAATFTMLEDYFDGLPLAASSKATQLRYIRAAYNYAIQRGLIRQNPALDIEIELGPDKEPRIIPGWCLRAIKDRALYEHEWLLYHLLTYTGMRRNEVRNLTWQNGRDDTSAVKLEEQTIRVIGKGGKLRLVPIHPALGEALAEAQKGKLYVPGGAVVTARAGKPVAEDTMQSMTKRLSTLYTPHDYRRTVATSLARNGVEDRIIDKIMGWAPPTVRGRYYVNVANEELQRAILKLYTDDPV